MRQFITQLKKFSPKPTLITPEGDWLFVFQIDILDDKQVTTAILDKSAGFRVSRNVNKRPEIIAEQAATFIGTHMQYALESACIDTDKVYFVPGPNKGAIVACIEDAQETAPIIIKKSDAIFKGFEAVDNMMFANWHKAGTNGSAKAVKKFSTKTDDSNRAKELLSLLGKAHGKKLAIQANSTQLALPVKQIVGLADIEQAESFSIH